MSDDDSPSGQDDAASRITVDAILANPMTVIEIPDGAIPIHAVVIVEYANPGAEYRPDLNRLGWVSDSTNSRWNELGMLEFCITRVRQAVAELTLFDDED